MLLIVLMMTSPITIANEYIEKTDNGYYLSEENAVKLANYIESLKSEIAKKDAKIEALEESLNSERKKQDEIQNRLDKVIEQKDKIIQLQNKQIDDLQLAVEHAKPSIMDKARWAGGGAGIASFIALLVIIQ